MIVCGLAYVLPIWAVAEDSKITVSNALDSFEDSSPISQPQAPTQETTEASQVPIQNPNNTAREGKKSFWIDILEFRDTDIMEALKVIAQKSGLNIVAGENVRGKITMYLKDVDARDALKMILASRGLAFIEEAGMIQVMTAGDFQAEYGYPFGEQLESKVIQLTNAQPSSLLVLLNRMKTTSGRIIADDKAQSLIIKDVASKVLEMEDFLKGVDVPLATEVFPLNYVTAEEMKAKLVGTMTPGLGHIMADLRSNKIAVTDTSQKIQEIAKIIKAFDEKEKELVIAVKIVQITLNDEHKDGVDWSAIVSDYHRWNLSTGPNLPGKDKKGKEISIGTVLGDDYEILLEALDTVGKTQVLSNPRLTVVNNKEERVLINASPEEITASGENFADESQISLSLKPIIHNNNDITLKISPVMESLAHENTVPETTLTVKDKVTIVIGGFMKEEKIPSIKKIPLLGDLPLLGFAFRNKREQIRKSEIVVFLTPKIMTGEAGIEKEEEDLSPQK